MISETFTFYIQCPFPACEWRSYEFDESYWHMRYRLDRIADYERHYQSEHHPIPLPHFVRTDKDA